MPGLPNKYVGTLLAFGERATINAGLTRFLAGTGGTPLASELAIVVPVAGRLKNLGWSASASTLTGGTHRCTVFVNGAATPLEATWTGPVLSGGNAATVVTVAAGDRVAVRLQLASGTTITRPRVTVALEIDSTSPWLADDPSDSDSNIFYVGSGNVGIGTDAPGERLSVDGIVEATGGFKFPDGQIQASAFGGAGAINVLTGAGGTPPDAVYVDDTGSVGIGVGSGRDPQEKLTLAPDSNVGLELSTPSGITAVPTAGGSLSPDDYFFKLAASEGTGWTTASPEFSATLAGANKSCLVSWGAVVGATSYKIFRAINSGGPWASRQVLTNSFLYDSDAGFASDTPPSETTAFVDKLTADGPSWILGGDVGIGTTLPQATLHVNGDLRLQSGVAVSEFSSDTALAANSDVVVATQRAVKEYVDGLLVGSVSAFGMEAPPTGWLECDGQMVSRATFARLFGRIGTAFGVGDGTTTFALPDLRGRFVRGWSHGSATDPDSTLRVTMAPGGAKQDKVGSVQADEFASHTHDALMEVGAEPVGGGAHAQEAAGAHGALLPQYTSTGLVQPRGGSETRPRNAYLMYCIKH